MELPLKSAVKLYSRLLEGNFSPLLAGLQCEAVCSVQQSAVVQWSAVCSVPSCPSSYLRPHLCFTITEKGHMIVPDWHYRILSYTKTYGKNTR